MRRSALFLRGSRPLAAHMSGAFRNTASGPRRGSPATSLTSMLDLMPAPGLIYNEWDKHGTCSGLGERAYFEAIRKARAAVKIPRNSCNCRNRRRSRPTSSRASFIKANPGLSNSGDLGDLQQQPAQRGADLHEQGPAIPRLRGNRSPRLPPRSGGDAAGSRRLKPIASLPDERDGAPSRRSVRLIPASPKPAGCRADAPGQAGHHAVQHALPLERSAITA